MTARTITLDVGDAARLVAYALAGIAAREQMPCARSDAMEQSTRGRDRRAIERIADEVVGANRERQGTLALGPEILDMETGAML